MTQEITPLFRHANLYYDHLEIAKRKFVQKYKREPEQWELLEFYKQMMEMFYD